MNQKLSKVQQRTLDKMEKGKWYSAYGLQASLATLEALLNKGIIVRSKMRPGDMFFPRVNIKFRKK